MKDIRNQWSVVGMSIFPFTLSAMLVALCVTTEAQQTEHRH